MMQFLEYLALPAVFLVAAASLLLLVIQEWRWSIFTLAVQFLGVFLLVTLSWPVLLAVVKLIAGWMAAALLAMSINVPRPEPASPLIEAPASQKAPPPPPFWVSGSLFRLSVAVMVALVVMSLAARLSAFFPGVMLEVILGAFFLIGNGLLQLSFTSRPLPVFLGMLTLLAGFEALYAAIETSALVAGLLAVVNLGLAMVGAYLNLTHPGEETT